MSFHSLAHDLRRLDEQKAAQRARRAADILGDDDGDALSSSERSLLERAWQRHAAETRAILHRRNKQYGEHNEFGEQNKRQCAEAAIRDVLGHDALPCAVADAHDYLEDAFDYGGAGATHS